MKNGLSLRSKDFHVLIFIPRMLKIILKKIPLNYRFNHIM